MEAERRQVTVLFTDVVGFTTFSERAGEEAAYTLMRRLSELMDEAVCEQGGVVQGFTGDGIMAVFGAPVAFEDAPLRACRAALSILQRIKVAGDELEVKYALRPQLRIGLNTGAAVVGKVQRGNDAGVTVLGDTVNVAARLQALAQPDSVLMSEVTHRLVHGMVETSSAGEREIKGKSEPQRVYRLEAIRLGATRFEAAVSRGLSIFVGRERELEVLERALTEARSEFHMIDIVAEPGMGKSRLLHEFRQRIGRDRAFILSGSCSPDTQQTPFFPFIEVVRGSFRISAGEAENEAAQKLERGLSTLGLHSARNLGLLLHLLGLKVPESALAGLDGLLIGLRTRELLQQLLEARCRISPVIMMLEDLHWIDSASQELLTRILESDAKLRLLLLTTRRPDHMPAWLDQPMVTKLLLEPLPVGHMRRLIQARLGVDVVPEALAQQVTQKAEGNPLFAEEIVSYLAEKGIIRTTVNFDPSALATVLPVSVQSLLTARVDRLASQDRALLQAASVIGRRFEPELLAAMVGESDIHARLEAMQAFDLVRLDAKSGDYSFKHALVRDALYQSLLSDARTALHAKAAQEVERRSGNRQVEVAEVLAHHYGQTKHLDKAFAYLAMAGSKSLGVYSLDEAATHLMAALTLLDNNSDCASDDQVADFLVSYALLLNHNDQVKTAIKVIERYLPRINHLDDARVIIIRFFYVFALVFNARYRDAVAAQRETSPKAERLGDSRSKAYSLAGEIFSSTMSAPKPLDEFERVKREALKAASDTDDVYIQFWIRIAVGWDELHRGLVTDARDSARESIHVGRRLGDPRSTGGGLAILTWIALLSDCYAEAEDYSEQALSIAIAPQDRNTALIGKGSALALLRQIDAGMELLEPQRRRCVVDGDLYRLEGTDGPTAVCKILQGDIGGGIRLLEEAIARSEAQGYRVSADWNRLTLCEVYLQIIGGNEKLPFLILLKNLPIIIKVMVTAPARIRSLMARLLENPQIHPNGHFVGRAQMTLGLLCKIRKKRALAIKHLTEAKRVLSAFGETPIYARLNAALAELGH